MGCNRFHLAIVVALALGVLASPELLGATAAPPECAFERRSYAPGESAVLVVWSGAGTTLRIDRVGHAAARARDPLAGAPITPAVRVRSERRLRVADRRLAERALRRPTARAWGRRPGTVRRPAAAARRAPRCRRAADQHLAGLQPPRRRRKRRRRQLVRAFRRRERRSGQALPRRGRAAAVPGLRPRFPSLGGATPDRRGFPRRRRPRAHRRSGIGSRGSTT